MRFVDQIDLFICNSRYLLKKIDCVPPSQVFIARVIVSVSFFQQIGPKKSALPTVVVGIDKQRRIMIFLFASLSDARNQVIYYNVLPGTLLIDFDQINSKIVALLFLKNEFQ